MDYVRDGGTYTSGSIIEKFVRKPESGKCHFFRGTHKVRDNFMSIFNYLFWGVGPFKCYVTVFPGIWTPTHPLVMLITLNLTPS